MKKLKLLLLLCVTCLCLLTGCEDYEKETYTEEPALVLETEPTSISALIPEVEALVHEHDPDGILTQAMAVYKGNDQVNAQKGTLYYTYCSEDTETERSTIIIVTYDIATKTVTELSYEEGNGLFVDASTQAIEPTAILATFDALFQAIKDNPDMSNKLDGVNIKLTIEFTSEGVKISIIY